MRGIAILLVLFHHALLWHHQDATCLADRLYAWVLETGWVGVDLFFVLSGYLITGILYDARKQKNYFRNFYARRVLRIFPLYFFVLVLLSFVFPLLPFSPAALHSAGSHQWSYWLYLSNFTVMLPPDYPAEARLVTWSLAIEEQFYIIWPAIILLCDRRRILIVSIGLLGLSIISRITIAMARIDPQVDYFWTPSHLDGLAMGAGIALLSRTTSGLKRMIASAPLLGVFGALGTALTAAVSFKRHLSMRQDPWGQVFLYTFVAMFSASLLIQGISQTGSVAAVFRTRLFRFFGKYSYGLYLYQAIVMAWLMKIGILTRLTVWHSRLPSQILFLLVATAASLVVAMASWHLMEKQFLKLKALFPEPPMQIPQMQSDIGYRS